MCIFARYHPHRRRRSDSADSQDPSPTRSPYRSKSGSPISFKKKRTPRSTVLTVQNKDGSQTPIPPRSPSPTGSHRSDRLGRGHVFDDSDERGSSAERGETRVGKPKPPKSYRKEYLSSCNTTPRVRDSDDEKSVKSVLSDKSSKGRRDRERSVESKERTKDK